jgi:hypothetical protein
MAEGNMKFLTMERRWGGGSLVFAALWNGRPWNDDAPKLGSAAAMADGKQKACALARPDE